MVYWAIATSSIYPDIFVEKIEAGSDQEAYEKAERWNNEHNGFRYACIVTKEISRNTREAYIEHVADIAEKGVKRWGGQK